MYETVPLDRPQSYPYTVFNAEQCSGLPQRETPRDANAWDPIEAAERALARTGAIIENSSKNRAYYDLRRDRIILPYRNQFRSGPAYYQTALHELGHWTGHPDRLNRATPVKGIDEGFASPHYACEELRAEISSMMTGDRLRLGHDPSRHAAYVGSWIEALRDDPREIYRAFQDAQMITDYVLDRPREKATERDAEGAPAPQHRPRQAFRPVPEQPQLRRYFDREPAGPSR